MWVWPYVQFTIVSCLLYLISIYAETGRCPFHHYHRAVCLELGKHHVYCYGVQTVVFFSLTQLITVPLLPSIYALTLCYMSSLVIRTSVLTLYLLFVTASRHSQPVLCLFIVHVFVSCHVAPCITFRHSRSLLEDKKLYRYLLLYASWT